MPSGPFDAMQGPLRELHQMAGWSGTAINYSPSGTTNPPWYDDTGGGDAGWDADGGVSITIRLIFGTAPRTSRGTGGGREITGDAEIAVDPSEHPAGKGGFTAGEGEENRATEIVDEDSGQRYRVLRVDDEHSGILVLDVEQLT